MPRQPRFWFSGAVLHVIQRGNNRAPKFVDDCDRQNFVDDLIAASRKHGVAVHAYVLMTNQSAWQVMSGSSPPSALARWLDHRYSSGLPTMPARTGFDSM